MAKGEGARDLLLPQASERLHLPGKPAGVANEEGEVLPALPVLALELLHLPDKLAGVGECLFPPAPFWHFICSLSPDGDCAGGAETQGRPSI